MSDLISALSQTLGVDSNTSQSAAGSVLGMIQQNAPAGALDGLLAQAPEAAGWLKAAGAGAPAAPAAGGLLGAASGLLGGGGGALGGLLGGAAAIEKVTSALQKVGVPPASALKALPLVIGFIQSKLGAERFAQLTAQVPFLKDLASAGSSAPAGGAGGMLGALGGLLK